MKQERGRCSRCGKNTVVRSGYAFNGRPEYVCMNGTCENHYTSGDEGEAWDTQPAPTRGDPVSVRMCRDMWWEAAVAHLASTHQDSLDRVHGRTRATRDQGLRWRALLPPVRRHHARVVPPDAEDGRFVVSVKGHDECLTPEVVRERYAGKRVRTEPELVDCPCGCRLRTNEPWRWCQDCSKLEHGAHWNDLYGCCQGCAERMWRES